MTAFSVRLGDCMNLYTLVAAWCAGALVSGIQAHEPFYRPAGTQTFPFNIPSFLVIGQQKTGTTTLYKLLRNNPALGTPRIKELLYWCEDSTIERCDRSVSIYLRQFDNVDRSKVQAIGEFSATYLACYCCPAVAKQINDKMKLIIVLREPISRAMSRYKEQRTYGGPFKQLARASASFGEFAKNDMQRIQSCLVEVSTRMPNITELKIRTIHYCYSHSSVLGLSVYALYIRHWLKYFPPEQFLFLHTTDLAEKPAQTLKEVETFLGIPHHEYPSKLLQTKFNGAGCYGWHTVCNTSAANRSSTVEIAPETVPELPAIIDFYKPHMQELQKIFIELTLKPPKDLYEFYPDLVQ